MKKNHIRVSASEGYTATWTGVCLTWMAGRILYRWRLIALLLLSAAQVLANPLNSPALNIHEDFTEESLTHHLLLLEDPSRQLTIDAKLAEFALWQNT